MKRILFINSGGFLGGAEQSLLLLLKALDQHRFAPFIVTFGEGLFSRRLREMGFDTTCMALPDQISRATRLYRRYRLRDAISLPLASLRPLLFLYRIIRRLKPDLVHTNGMKAHILGGLAAKLAGVPLVWHVRDFLPSDHRQQGLRTLATFLPTRIIVNSDAVGGQFKGSRAFHKVRRIYNAVDLKAFEGPWDGDRLRRELGLEKETPTVGLIAHLTPWKGQEDFIKASATVLRKMPQVRFLIVGDALYTTDGHSGYWQHLKDLCKALQIQDRIVFAGFRDDVPALLRLLDLVVHCSRLPEPFGRVLIEAMAAEKPVVATRGGGVDEVIIDGVTGVLVPPQDPDTLATSIVDLLTHRERAEAMGKAGRERVEKHFTLPIHLQQVEQVYGEILNMEVRSRE